MTSLSEFSLYISVEWHGVFSASQSCFWLIAIKNSFSIQFVFIDYIPIHALYDIQFLFFSWKWPNGRNVHWFSFFNVENLKWPFKQWSLLNLLEKNTKKTSNACVKTKTWWYCMREIIHAQAGGLFLITGCKFLGVLHTELGSASKKKK